jgi:type I restriction enzyme S subunit
VEQGEGVPFISVRNIRTTGVDWETAKYISWNDYREYSRRVKPEIGDVLLTKGGSTGIATVVDFDQDFHVWVHVAILKLDRSLVEPAYVVAVLNSTPGYEQSQLLTRGATNQDLVLNRIATIRMPLPPLQVQREIAARAAARGERHRVLGELLAEQVRLLGEHRQALITAAVTGQLDIPGVAA